MDSTDIALPRTDADGFAALLHANRGIVYKVAAAYAWHEDERADLAQDIATQLWSAYPGYDPARPFATWMYRVALNTAMAHARNREVRQRHVESIDDLAHDAVAAAEPDRDASLLLRQAMASLDAASRALLLLHLEARSSQEIGDILGLSVTAVTTRLNRIRQRLRASFGAH